MYKIEALNDKFTRFTKINNFGDIEDIYTVEFYYNFSVSPFENFNFEVAFDNYTKFSNNEYEKFLNS